MFKLLPGEKIVKNIMVTGNDRFVPMEFSAVEKDENVPLNINKQEHFVVTPTPEPILHKFVLEESKFS